MAPMFQGFPVHVEGVRLAEDKNAREEEEEETCKARQSLYGLHRPQRSFVRCLSLLQRFQSYSSAPPPPSPLPTTELLLIFLS